MGCGMNTTIHLYHNLPSFREEILSKGYRKMTEPKKVNDTPEPKDREVPTSPASKGKDSHLLDKDDEVVDMDEELEREAEDAEVKDKK
jgi:hypothetical protein